MSLDREYPEFYGAGRDRLIAWDEAGRPDADVAALCIVGDREIVEAARAVFAQLPAYARHYIAGHAYVVCGGISTRGWVSPMPVLPCAQPVQVNLSNTAPETIAHEFSHVWQTDFRAHDAYPLTVEQRERLRTGLAVYAIETGKIDEWAEDIDNEVAADMLASKWLARPVDTTSGSRGDSRRRHQRREIEDAADAADAGGEP
jgi:hypothetical protein